MNSVQNSLAFCATLLVTAAAVQAEDAVRLAYKFEKGNESIYRTHSEMSQTQTVMGMDITNKMTQDQVSTATVESVDEEGNGVLKLRLDHTRFRAEFGALGEYVFDSKSQDNDKASILGQSVTPVFERMTGAELVLTVSSRGTVLKVKGYADLFQDLLKDNPLGGQFVGGGSDDAFKISAQDQFPEFKKEAVSPGDSWEIPYKQELPKLGKYSGKKVYTYAGPGTVGDRKTLRINVASEISLDMDFSQGPAKLKGKLSSSDSSGVFHLDPATGQVVLLESSVTLSGQMIVEANGMTIPIDMTQTQKNKVELLEEAPE